MSEPIVIAGAGTAAAKAAETLRKLGASQPIVMIGDEPYPPYQRPPLSKRFLAGEMAEAQLWLHGSEFFTRHGIALRLGRRVTALDPATRTLTLDDGAAQHYGALLLATGSRPRSLNLPGAGLAGIHTLRGIGDVARMRPELGAARRIVIVGGGYIGLEVAAVLRAMGKPVSVLEAQERLAKRALCPIVAGALEQRHRAHGVDIRLGARLVAFAGHDRVAAVTLADGAIDADLVLVAIGGVANDELAAAAGLATADGICVDTRCRAGEAIYAAGDCARLPLPRYGAVVRLESVQNANDQARAAAVNMLGGDEVYDPVPWFWSDQHDVKLQIAGLADGHDRSIVDGDTSAAFSVSYLKGDRLLAVASVNAPRAHMEARRALAAQAPLSAP